MAGILISVVSGLMSALIAILSTIAIEKLGGIAGGCLATTPTTIIPFSIGMALDTETSGLDGTSDYASIDAAMFAVPCAIALTAVFLVAWRELPSLPYIARLDERGPRLSLALVLALTLATWLGGAALLVFLLPLAADRGVSVQATGLLGLITNIVIGFTALYYRSRPAPGGKRPVTLVTYLSRGVLAGVMVTISMLVSRISPTLAGIASVFPSITLSSMVSLWWSQGKEVPQGAATSMMLGNLSVSVYGMLFAVLWPHVHARGAVPLALALIATPLLCWTLAAFCVSVPLFTLIQSRKSALAANAWSASGCSDGSGSASEMLMVGLTMTDANQ